MTRWQLDESNLMSGRKLVRLTAFEGNRVEAVPFKAYGHVRFFFQC